MKRKIQLERPSSGMSKLPLASVCEAIEQSRVPYEMQTFAIPPRVRESTTRPSTCTRFRGSMNGASANVGVAVGAGVGVGVALPLALPPPEPPAPFPLPAAPAP